MFKSINGGQLPQRATKYSAGFDVFANESAVIGAGETKLIGLGIALNSKRILWSIAGKYPYIGQAPSKNVVGDFQKDFYFALHIRSSLRAKGLTSLGTGIIDMDYRDEIKMVIHNPIKSTKHYKTDADGEIYLDGIFTDLRSEYKIKKGDKIGQLILCRHEGWLLPSEYTKYVERDGGFGSTGA